MGTIKLLTFLGRLTITWKSSFGKQLWFWLFQAFYHSLLSYLFFFVWLSIFVTFANSYSDLIYVSNRKQGGIGSNLQKPELFNEIFLHYSTPLFYYVSKFVDDEAARDIVQDTFIKLWTDKTISIKLPLNSLLLTLVRNCCLQHIEKLKVRNKYLEHTKLLLQEEELHFYSEEKTSLIEQEAENKLNEILNTLSDRSRQVFVMSRFENKKNKEIARELNISVKAVEKHINKSLSTIRTELKDYLPALIFLLGSLD